MAEPITVIKTTENGTGETCYKVQSEPELNSSSEFIQLKPGDGAEAERASTKATDVVQQEEQENKNKLGTIKEGDESGDETGDEPVKSSSGGGLFNFIRKTRPTMNKIQKSIKNLSNVLINKGDALRVGKGYNKTKCAYKNVLCSINDHHRCQKKTLKELFKNLKKQNHENRRRTNKRRK